MTTLDQLLAQINAATGAHACQETETACRDFLRDYTWSNPQQDSLEKILGGLKSRRWFASLVRIADQMIACGAGNATIFSLYAQGLIDQGAVEAAITLLTAKLSSANIPKTRSEMTGLLGRAYKQRFVETNRLGLSANNDLKQSIKHYAAVYATDPAWHGANLVALVRRAERMGIEHEHGMTSHQIARKVIKDIGTPDPKNLYHAAALGEVSLALGNHEEVIGYYKTYLNHANIQPFHLAGSARQLREIWLPESDGKGLIARILKQLDAKILSFASGGGELCYTPTEVQRIRQGIDEHDDEWSGQLQAVHGQNPQLPLRILKTLLKRAPHVCKVVNRFAEQDHIPSGGTGFIVHGRTLRKNDQSNNDEWNQPVLITNNHVLSSDGRFPSVISHQANILFHDWLGEGKTKKFTVKKLLKEFPRDDLDVCIATINWGNDLPNNYLPINDEAHLLQGIPSSPPDKVYVIDHPQGRGLEFSLSDNQILDHELITAGPGRPSVQHRRIHYQAPTQVGNSGSPVFDAMECHVIGIHRAGDVAPLRDQDPPIKDYAANEAVWIGSVKARLAE